MGAPLDLDLDLSRVIGRKPRPASAEVLRELTASDIALLETERGIKPSHITRLSDRHHSLARCLATGLSVFDSCAITGYTPSRVSILRGDPSFEELIEFYRQGKGELVKDIGQQMAVNAKMALQIEAKDLELKPESFDHDARNDIIKRGADRTGFGPASKTTNTHTHFIGLADRVDAAGKAKLIEGKKHG